MVSKIIYKSYFVIQFFCFTELMWEAKMPIEDMRHKGVIPGSGATLPFGKCCTTMCRIDLQLVHLIKKAPIVDGGFF